MNKPIEILEEKIKNFFKDCIFEMEIEKSANERYLHVIFKIDDCLTFEAQADIDNSLEHLERMLYAFKIYFKHKEEDEKSKILLCSNFGSFMTTNEQLLDFFSMIKNEKRQKFYEIIGALKALNNTIDNIYEQKSQLLNDNFFNNLDNQEGEENE